MTSRRIGANSWSNPCRKAAASLLSLPPAVYWLSRRQYGHCRAHRQPFFAECYALLYRAKSHANCRDDFSFGLVRSGGQPSKRANQGGSEFRETGFMILARPLKPARHCPRSIGSFP